MKIFRDVPQFTFEFDDVQTSNVFSVLLLNANLWKKSLFYDRMHMHREPKNADKSVFFFKFSL